ncbi:Cell fate regulator YaaT, PSP1 superfamily (controls sporulation, competence, biofilm development) [Ruminococcus sp. YE71]|uniref:PSP1 domain-containing protein n=1 Tax=unclassified Ruminococcus TaxID=2608920 RepID=UPI0008850F5C|nr:MULTISPECIES: stage 0 sporulation family protein [unclassified Ruminococcus]SDA12470.1 Cell fate regulator YaaT, PSP1 superfamily (controls sporulation, competence, biofilm development) [Ruminococcus sp. YE78]SFW16973.1 Cell fate regulator YaaT, PSP1 superfamily (controls sporulation, competence, biofilm development) [Ruminococcus sp. YE71]
MDVKYIGVRFKRVGKIYYFAPGDINVVKGDKVIVETVRGVECGDVVIEIREMPEEQLTSPLKTIIRIATKRDLETIERNKKKEKEAFAICEEKIKKHGLKMDLVDVECTFDNNKLLFYFTAKNRVDFRELVKDLAGVFRTRIELRQIGVRDEAKLLGGLGICGQPFCCSRFLGDFHPVSVKMAKEQSLSLNPTKLSGSCGRLMCCLKYESEAYQDLLRTTPKVGAVVKTSEGKGTVIDVNLLTGILKVKPDKSDNILTVKKDDVEVIKDGVVKLDKNELRALKQLEGK